MHIHIRWKKTKEGETDIEVLINTPHSGILDVWLFFMVFFFSCLTIYLFCSQVIQK